LAYKTIDYQVKDGIAQISLMRPDKLNAVNSLMSKELPKMWKRFNEDATAIVAIISGYGDKSFCVGADLADLPDMDGEAGMASLESIKWTSLQNDIWKPVICAVNGMVCGGGLHFVADSDVVIASENATFFDTHVKVGLVAGLEPVSLSRKIPLERVLRMSLIGGGEKIDSNEAKNIGLISEIVNHENLMARAIEIANNIKIHSPSALAKTKKAIWQSQDTGLNQGLKNAWNLISKQQIHPDFEEGAKAFIEKRLPKWKPYNPNE
jgi:E-phenylitaconyl-CoA hydratase